jgi:hypothetical protein
MTPQGSQAACAAQWISRHASKIATRRKGRRRAGEGRLTRSIDPLEFSRSGDSYSVKRTFTSLVARTLAIGKIRSGKGFADS